MRHVTFCIERDVPLGRAGFGPKRRSPYRALIEGLGVGESVHIEGGDHTIRACAHHASRFSGRRFATRSEGDGIRVWRLPDEKGPAA